MPAALERAYYVFNSLNMLRDAQRFSSLVLSEGEPDDPATLA